MTAAVALVPQTEDRRSSLVRLPGTPAEILAFHEDVAKVIVSGLKNGVDYGKMPGQENKSDARDVLYKAGAERICFLFGVYPKYSIIEKEVEHNRVVPWVKRKKVWRNAHQGDKHFDWAIEQGESLGLYRYLVKCTLHRRDDDRVVAESDGSCSTMESKYIDRPRDSENTVLKMAQKRAMVAAALNGFALSDRFTQDVEEEAYGGREVSQGVPSGAPPAEEAEYSVESNGSSEAEAKCPKCSGRMWDNRTSKTNSKAPDYKCRDKSCDGAYWPGQWPPAPAATEEMKAKILELLAVADLKDERKAKMREMVNDTAKPLSAKRALEAIEKLEQLAEPEDPNQAEMNLAGAPRSGSAAPASNPTELKPGKIEDVIPPSDKPSAMAPVTEYMRKINALFKDSKFESGDGPEQLAAFKKKREAAENVDDLKILLHDVDTYVGLPF
jgi:hypothetical protein